jgi:large subunit ribosomal protein L14
MIQPRSIVKITDNAGGKVGRVFKVLGGSKKRYAQIGELVVISVQIAEPRKGVKKKDVHRAVVAKRTKSGKTPRDWSMLKSC